LSKVLKTPVDAVNEMQKHDPNENATNKKVEKEKTNKQR